MELIQISTVISWSCTPYTSISVLFPRTGPERADEFINFTSIHNLVAELACILDKIYFSLINHCNLINHNDSNPSYQTPSENRNDQLKTCPLKIFLHCAKWPLTNNIRGKKCDHLKTSGNIVLFVGVIFKSKEISSSNPFTGMARQQCGCHVLTLSISRQDTGKLVSFRQKCKELKKQFQKGPNTEWLHLKMRFVVQHIPKNKKCYFCVWRQFESSLIRILLISEVLCEVHPALYSPTKLLLWMMVQSTDSKATDVLVHTKLQF